MKIVLCYHRISNFYDDFNLMNVSIHNFEMHMKYIKKHFELISLEQLMKEIRDNDERNQIAITFDDGYRDVYLNVYPILEKYQIPATAFITTENIDTEEENWPDLVMRACLQPAIYYDYFDIENELTTLRCYTRNLQERCNFYAIMGDICARLSAHSRKEQLRKLKLWAGIDGGRDSRRILNTEEIRTLANSPLIIIGSHTVTHPILRHQSREEQLNEIKGSQNKLEAITGKKHQFFAFPYGGKDAYDEFTLEMLKENGYQLAVTTEPKNVSPDTDLYQIPRYVVYNYDDKDFEKFLDKIFEKEDIKSKRKSSLSEKNKDEIQLAYIGTLKDDLEVISGTRKVVIWGYGYWGRELYTELRMLGLENNVLAFGDKEAEKYNVTDNGVPVMCAEEIVSAVKLSEVSILIKGTYDWDIFMELKKRGFRNLHIILR